LYSQMVAVCYIKLPETENKPKRISHVARITELTCVTKELTDTFHQLVRCELTTALTFLTIGT
jgi:hypothetical protein